MTLLPKQSCLWDKKIKVHKIKLSFLQVPISFAVSVFACITRLIYRLEKKFPN